MKIAWLTPFAPPSAIGAYSRLVTNELARHCAVEIWAPVDNSYSTELPIRPLAELRANPGLLDGYSHVVYNMGNHMPFHWEIYEVLVRRPGILILHDIVMHHFFAGYHHDHRHDPHGYRNELVSAYGDVGASIHARLSSGEQVWETSEALDYPLFEPCLRHATAVVTHSQFLAEAARKNTIYPVEAIPLALAMDLEEAQAAIARAPARDRNRKLLVVSFGMIGVNKRVDRVIEMLGRNKSLAQRIEYRILGRIGPERYQRKLQDLVARYDLGDTVTFMGYQSTPVLYDLLLAADVCINLRYPPTEGGSASLNDALFFGCPTIVTDIGCYRDVPDDCVIKISPARELEGLRQALVRLLDSPDLRSYMSGRAKAYADERLSPAAYTRDLLKFFGRIGAFAPRLNLLHRVASELGAMQLTPGAPAFSAIAHELGRIWPAAQPQPAISSGQTPAPDIIMASSTSRRA